MCSEKSIYSSEKGYKTFLLMDSESLFQGILSNSIETQYEHAEFVLIGTTHKSGLNLKPQFISYTL